MEKPDPLTPLGRRVLNEVKARAPEVEPGYRRGNAELLNPVELGWRLVKETVELEIPPNIILGEE